MTLEDWLAAKSAGPLSVQIAALSDRKIQLLTAAFLRRVWKLLPSHHAQVAVEATEAFADGRMTKSALARLRVTDTLETFSPLWFSADPDWHTGSWFAALDYWGESVHEVYEQTAVQLEQRVANYGHVLPCVKAGIEWPHWVAAKAAFLARKLVAWQHAPHRETEAIEQFKLLRELAGPEWASPDPHWPRWRTWDVRALARGIHRDRAFDRMPILADALQDAGCDDESVLRHCREEKEHARGCWVVDLALGLS